MKIERQLIEDILESDYNPRVHLDSLSKEYKAIKKSIEDYGFVEPIVVNDINMSCIGGHQRLTVMRDMGKKEIDCVMVHIENPEREKILCIALNKIKGEWDNDKLDKLLHDDEIRQFELGFDKIITTIDDEFFDSESEFDDNDFENNAEADDDCSDCEDESDNIKTIIKIGSYRFDITTTEYNKMLCDIRDRGIFEKSKIIDELRRKLCND